MDTLHVVRGSQYAISQTMHAMEEKGASHYATGVSTQRLVGQLLAIQFYTR